MCWQPIAIHALARWKKLLLRASLRAHLLSANLNAIWRSQMQQHSLHRYRILLHMCHGMSTLLNNNACLQFRRQRCVQVQHQRAQSRQQRCQLQDAKCGSQIQVRQLCERRKLLYTCVHARRQWMIHCRVCCLQARQAIGSIQINCRTPAIAVDNLDNTNLGLPAHDQGHCGKPGTRHWLSGGVWICRCH